MTLQGKASRGAIGICLSTNQSGPIPSPYRYPNQRCHFSGTEACLSIAGRSACFSPCWYNRNNPTDFRLNALVIFRVQQRPLSSSKVLVRFAKSSPGSICV
ncbi:hypothetical protein NPIL_164991 [Nephila pilipes]|uniref:Uncharacterized protein n=1 Tax=Nephila pilipes TaxID=299642 RepID=A0A8X6PHX3_NEPPI|nr:hypothetical protein NPIL_164991 [Nephila pilipes]